VADALSSDKLFGINFFNAELTSNDRPEVGSIGCVAEMRDVTVLPDERSNIMVKGLLRYRIVEFVENEKPYLTARVECFEDSQENKDAAKGIAEEVFALFDRIAQAAFKLSRDRRRYESISQDDPEKLSFMVMAAFNLENQLKYDLLKTIETSERLMKLRDILTQVAPSIEEQSQLLEVSQKNGHSDKHIDLD
jgi:Lon protease-like protein